MKIYTKIIMSIKTGEVIKSESYDYDGPVVLCKGGGGAEPDKAYNARMAAIAEKELKMAQTYFKFWEFAYKPMEYEQIQANRKMIPELTQQQLLESQVEQEQLKGLLRKDREGVSLLGLEQQTARAAYKAALAGVDERAKVAEAKADVSQAYANTLEGVRRDVTRSGLDISSERYLNAIEDIQMQKTKDTIGAMTKARSEAEEMSFNRLRGLLIK